MARVLTHKYSTRTGSVGGRGSPARFSLNSLSLLLTVVATSFAIYATSTSRQAKSPTQTRTTHTAGPLAFGGEIVPTTIQFTLQQRPLCIVRVRRGRVSRCARVLSLCRCRRGHQHCIQSSHTNTNTQKTRRKRVVRKYRVIVVCFV